MHSNTKKCDSEVLKAATNELQQKQIKAFEDVLTPFMPYVINLTEFRSTNNPVLAQVNLHLKIAVQRLITKTSAKTRKSKKPFILKEALILSNLNIHYVHESLLLSWLGNLPQPNFVSPLRATWAVFNKLFPSNIRSMKHVLHVQAARIITALLTHRKSVLQVIAEENNIHFVSTREVSDLGNVVWSTAKISWASCS